MQSVSGTFLVVLATLAGGAALAQEPVVAVATVSPAVAPPSGGSGVRIVRLSQVRGVVRMDRNTGRGFETAFANIPVIGGARLATGQGIAEVEFEDNSSLRLVPDTEVQFTELSRTASGTTVTSVAVLKGEAYVSVEKTKGNVFTLSEGDARVLLTPGTHVRLDAAPAPDLALAVFEGQAAVTLGGATQLVSKHQTVDVNPAARTVSFAKQGTEEQNYDAWDKQERDYHRQKASFAGTGGFGLYGANDLNYYGNFGNVPGCGNVWRPYFADASWDPFASGVWAWYPTAGYSWVSPYPWGWLPYHSGSWVSCGGAGWGWRPGGSWYGLSNNGLMQQTAIRLPGHGLPHPAPPSGPARNESTLVPVNMKALPVSGVAGGDRFAFRQNSAGLGVPRAEYGNLHGVASHVDRRGMVMTERGMSPMTSPASMRGGAEVGSVTGGRSNGVGATSAMRPAGGGGAGAPSHGNYGGGMTGGNMGAAMRGGSAGSMPSPAPSASAGGGSRK